MLADGEHQDELEEEPFAEVEIITDNNSSDAENEAASRAYNLCRCFE